MKLLKHFVLLLAVTLLAVLSARGATNVVTTANDTGAGSLRQTIVNSISGDTITFTNTLSGSNIVLTSGQLLLNKNLTINASALPGGIRINGNGTSRVFNVPTGVTAVLHSLTVTNGLGTAGFLPGNGGGGAYCEGTLILNNCTFVRNVVPFLAGTISLGGAVAIYHGTFTATNSTFALNSIQAANTAYGGAIVANGSTLLFHHCTIVSNTATGGGGGNGGGILSDGGTVQLGHTIVVGNIGSIAADLSGIGGATLTSQGYNLLGNGTGSSGFVHGVNGDQVGTAATPINPLLAPLGNYGGPTMTMLPLPSSPVIDAAATTSLTTDQRGFPRPVDGNGDGIAVADIGAVESSVPLNVLVIWDINTGATLALSSALANAGLAVTLSSTSETGYNGANPSPTGFNAVIHLNGTTYGFDMPLAGQVALSNYVANGGGYIQGEFDAYEYSNGRMANMRDLILFDRSSGHEGSLTYSTVPAQAGHPVLATVPSSFTFLAGANIGLAHVFSVNPVTVLMTEGANDAVAVRQFGLGRISGFSHTGNYNSYPTLSDGNVQQLYINAVNWSAKSVLTVVNTLDSGVGSLRKTVADATTGATIRFAPYLSGSNIVLTSGQLLLNKNLTIDASALPGGILINGNGASRVFYVTNGIAVVLNSLTISNGVAPAGFFADGNSGGGIFNRGRLDLLNCTLVRNSVPGGGSAFAGAIGNYGGDLRLTNCTLTLNSTWVGGAIYSYLGSCALSHCTIASNTASLEIGGVITESGPLSLEHTLLANPARDLRQSSATITSGGYNLVSDGTGSGLVNGVNGDQVGTTATPINPRLGPLQNNGGPTPTLLLTAGSPALDAGNPSFIGLGLTDQRGFPRVSGGRVDIGAVENCLMLYYPVANSTVVDVSGSSTAQLQGAGVPLFGFDRFSQGGQSLALNDPVNTQNQYYRLRTGTTNNSVLDLGLTDDFTVSVWVWQRGGAAATNGWKVILGLTGATSGPDNPVFGLFSGRMYLSYWGNDVPGNRVIAPSIWTHLAWTYRSHGGQIALYVNGQLDASTVGHAHAPRAADLLVGFSEAVAGSYFQGALDDLAIYCEALSPNQIAALAGNTAPDSPLPAPVLSPGLAASGPCDWSVREIYAHTNDPALMPYDLPSAEYVASATQFGKTTNYTSSVINRRDPDTNPGGSGFFGGDLPFKSDNLTPQGLINTDDNYFVLAARTTILVAIEDDYTFGFSTDDGARLRIPGAVFSSSTRLDVGNPANPAHRGDTLSYPGNTGDSRTLGVTHLTPGSYDVEFITWELGGGSFAEVFAARGAKTAVDGTFSLLSSRLPAPRPVLAIQRISSTQVRVTWTPSGPCDHLQSAPNLAGPWIETGTANGQVIAISPGQQFFRVAQ